MMHQGVVLQGIFICFYVLLTLTSKLVVSTPSDRQDTDSRSKTAQDTELRTVPLSTSSIHRTNEILKPSQIRNRRSNALTDKEQFVDDNAGLDSAFLYSDQIMQNLLNIQSPKPLTYARSNFFLNLLKPRTTRYNAWDDHSLMHFGKRSAENENGGKILVKRSADSRPSESILNLERQQSRATENNEPPQAYMDIVIPGVAADEFREDSWTGDSDRSSKTDGKNVNDVRALEKKSKDPWHSMMSFGKKSQNPWEHSTLHFGKKNDPWHHTMNFGKRSENPWEHNTMHFGKKNDPWHSMMSFGKKSDPWHSMMSFGKRAEDTDSTEFEKRDDPWHNMMSFGKKSDPWHSMMSFGKKSENPWEHNTLHFGKRDEPWHNMMSFGKRPDYPWDHNTLHFGKRDDPWHNMMSFGKRSDLPWDHNTLHFGKKSDPWHNMMSFGKKSETSDGTELEKREDPWHNMMSFGKKSEPWHNMMSFGKRSENPWEHSTLHFGKREDPWHNMMSFGKKSDPWHSMMSFGKRPDYSWDHNTLHFGKKNDPWHSMMSFGKRSDAFNDTVFDKRDEPWHNMMSFGKRSENDFNDNPVTGDKRDEPWHNMMSFGKKSDDGFGEHFTLHFGKRDDPWHNMMSFGKKSDTPWDHSTLHFGKKDDPWHNMMSFGKRSDGMIEYDEPEDFSNPWENYNAMAFYKKSDPWEHNTLHFGKKSNTSSNSISSTPKSGTATSKHIQKRSAGVWGDHQTMHFGKKSYPWENLNSVYFGKASKSPNAHSSMSADKKFEWDPHSTMHFGKKSDPWEYHNTMHFGKKRNPWDYHNTMHFGKKQDPWEYHNTMHFGKRSHEGSLKEGDTSSQNNMENEENERGTKERESKTDEKQLSKDIFEASLHEKENDVSVQKRSVAPVKSKLISDNTYKNKAENKNSDVESHINTSDNHQEERRKEAIKRSLKNAEQFNKNPKIRDGINTKFSHPFPDVRDEKEIIKQNTAVPSTNKKSTKKNKTLMAANTDTKSRITKRSVENSKSTRDSSENMDTNPRDFEEYSKDEFPDTVLHFGKRSVYIPTESEVQGDIPWLDDAEEKRLDYWDNYNTLHFGKKSDPWESHSTMHFGKRNPWDYHSTMHFGKKFDPWDGHHQMHFGKRSSDWDHSVMHFGKKSGDWDHSVMHFGKKSGDWDHSVMHFGKREGLENNQVYDTEDILALLSDPEKLKILLLNKNSQEEGNDLKNKELLADLENLENVVNVQLRDESIPFEEKLNLLKSYLKPILKIILSGQSIEEKNTKYPFLDSRQYANGEVINSLLEENENTEGIPARTIINDKSYDEDLLPNDGEDVGDEENSKWIDSLEHYQDYVKSKRAVLGKPELKRYFVPFQGPKSIVYPHAWFASQIRRSTLPRTSDLARSMEMRMAEKKEDPFNSYMHFGRR